MGYRGGIWIPGVLCIGSSSRMIDATTDEPVNIAWRVSLRSCWTPAWLSKGSTDVQRVQHRHLNNLNTKNFCKIKHHPSDLNTHNLNRKTSGPRVMSDYYKGQRRFALGGLSQDIGAVLTGGLGQNFCPAKVKVGRWSWAAWCRWATSGAGIGEWPAMWCGVLAKKPKKQSLQFGLCFTDSWIFGTPFLWWDFPQLLAWADADKLQPVFFPFFINSFCFLLSVLLFLFSCVDVCN